mmetsp:Transcript_21848/g.56987  ORF Transcript_21848/g.56987 Transcript_21848/m.56987 type:complete len:211 (+) Transcript_21848:354-986(+)
MHPPRPPARTNRQMHPLHSLQTHPLHSRPSSPRCGPLKFRRLRPPHPRTLRQPARQPSPHFCQRRCPQRRQHQCPQHSPPHCPQRPQRLPRLPGRRRPPRRPPRCRVPCQRRGPRFLQQPLKALKPPGAGAVDLAASSTSSLSLWQCRFLSLACWSGDANRIASLRDDCLPRDLAKDVSASTRSRWLSVQRIARSTAGLRHRDPHHRLPL